MSVLPSNHLQDPRTKFACPPFPHETQELPGTSADMHPSPDYGENSYIGSGKLKGMVALITGGDSGIGRAVALAYAREGADVVFTYLGDMEREDAKATEELVRDAGQSVISIQMDQASAQACVDAVERTVSEFGRLDILVNNAAFQQTYASLNDIPEEDIHRFFEVNIEGFYHFSKAALKHIPPGGSIINTSSIQAFDPSSVLSPYAATKAAIANFTKSLAKEAIDKGIRVNAVAPGPVWTPLIPASMPEDAVSQFGKKSLFGRPAQPVELAPVYVFLASSDASFISGEVYGVTGGEKQL